MNELKKYLIQNFKEVDYSYQHHNHVLLAPGGILRPLLTALKNDCEFIMLLDICGVDNLQRNHSKRFECVYHLLNMGEHQRLRLRIPIDPGESLPTITDIWKTADWFEREVWDMFGIEFKGKKKGTIAHPPRICRTPPSKRLHSPKKSNALFSSRNRL